MNLADRIERLEALHGRANAGPPPDILAGSFPQQRAFVDCPAPYSAAFCTRRAAKSYGAALKAIKAGEKFPKSSVLILGLVREEIKRIYWEPILKELDERYRLGMRFNETTLTARLQNGSRIYLLGADANENEKRKILGQKFPLVIIDEAQDFVTDLAALIEHVLTPAVTDYAGQICMLGTPGLITKGLFYDVTTGKAPGWKIHEWTAFDNPYMAEKWRAKIEELKRTKPGVEATPWFRRNYLREWVVDTEALVYRYQAGRNDFHTLPTYRKGEWHRVLGVDLGYADASAFVLTAYHDHDPTLYGLDVFRKSGMDVTDVADRIKATQARYADDGGIDHVVIDGANKQAVEEMRRRHDLGLVCADKTGKADFIELMNAEMIIGRVKVNPATCKDLASEWQSLIWDQKAATKKEHEACENHAADAALYAWRFSYPYLSQPAPEDPEPEDVMEAAAERQFMARLAESGIEREGVGDSSQWEWFHQAGIR